MKENYEFFKMIKTMAYLDIITGLALGVIVGIINRNYLIISFLGFFMAIMSFYINAYLVNYTVAKNKENSKGMIIVNFIFKIIVISAIGLLVFTYNKFNVIAYMGGYSFRFFSLLMYGLIIRNS